MNLNVSPILIGSMQQSTQIISLDMDEVLLVQDNKITDYYIDI